MYINTKVFSKSGLKVSELFIVQLISQKDFLDEEPLLSKVSRQRFIELEDRKYIEKLKNPLKSYPYWKIYRLTKKTKGILRDIQIPDITLASKKLSKYLIDLYQDNNLSINKNSNKKEINELIAWFLANVDFSPKEIFGAVEDYINNTDRKYISSLSNLIWKPDNVYSTNKTLSKSKLYGLMT